MSTTAVASVVLAVSADLPELSGSDLVTCVNTHDVATKTMPIATKAIQPCFLRFSLPESFIVSAFLSCTS